VSLRQFWQRRDSFPRSHIRQFEMTDAPCADEYSRDTAALTQLVGNRRTVPDRVMESSLHSSCHTQKAPKLLKSTHVL
jgi:hypothetical protein